LVLLDPLGPALRLLTDVADSTLVIFRFGATLELGRSERPTKRPLWSYGVDGADSPDRKPRRLWWGCGVLSLRHFRLASWDGDPTLIDKIAI